MKPNCRGKCIRLFILSAAILVFACPANAKQFRIKLGNLQIFPEITYEVDFNDNIYLEEEEEESDVVHRIKPRISVAYGTRSIGISADPEGGINAGIKGNNMSMTGNSGGGLGTGISGKYFTAGYRTNLGIFSSNDDNNFQTHNPFISFNFGDKVGFYARLDENYYWTSDPYGNENEYNRGEKTKRWNNNAGIILGYGINKRHSIEAFYNNFLERFDAEEDEWQNSLSHQYGLSAVYNMTRRISFFGQYRRTDTEYDEQNDGLDVWNSNNSEDYALNDYFIGVRFVPGGKTSGAFKFGWGEKIWENDFDPFGREYENERTWVAESYLNYRPFNRTSLSLELQRSFQGAPDQDATSYVDTVIELGLNQGIGDRVKLDTGIRWTHEDFDEEYPGKSSKYFNIYAAWAGIDVRILKWLTAGVEYTYEEKIASNEEYEADEYKNNIFQVRANLKF